jgi:hypothetical protein
MKKQVAKGYILPREYKEREMSGYRKEASYQGALTL